MTQTCHYYISSLFMEIVCFIELVSTSHIRLDLIQVQPRISEVRVQF